MRHATAVRRLRLIAERAQQVCGWWEEGTGLVAVHAFGEVVEPPTESGAVEVVQVVLVVHAEPDQVPWCARPPEFAGLPYVLELEKAPVDWYFWPAALPVGNHAVVGAVRIWDRAEGVDGAALAALAAGRAEPFRPPPPGAIRRRQQTEEDLAAALAHLRRVRDRYWQRKWRSEHHTAGMYPENHLWDAVHGYLDLLAVTEAAVGGGTAQPSPGRPADPGHGEVGDPRHGEGREPGADVGGPPGTGTGSAVDPAAGPDAGADGVGADGVEPGEVPVAGPGPASEDGPADAAPDGASPGDAPPARASRTSSRSSPSRRTKR